MDRRRAPISDVPLIREAFDRIREDGKTGLYRPQSAKDERLDIAVGASRELGGFSKRIKRPA